jgi:hypothetical protein
VAEAEEEAARAEFDRTPAAEAEAGDGSGIPDRALLIVTAHYAVVKAAQGTEKRTNR